MRYHELKTEPVYFDAVETGEKTFEVRKNDRFFQSGDIVDLLKYDPDPKRMAYVTDSGYSGLARNARRLRFRVGPILQGGQFGIEPGYCAFSLLPVKARP